MKKNKWGYLCSVVMGMYGSLVVASVAIRTEIKIVVVMVHDR